MTFRRQKWASLFTFVLIVLLSVGIASAETAKNVVLFIGDGMGAAQRTLAYYYLGFHPVMNQMSTVGMFTTHMDSGYITDSAAAGTAMATGKKTYDGAIGVGPDKKPLKTVLEVARDAGKATGLVATSRLSHATPASFAAHEEDRDYYDAIMADFLEARVDVLLGGGMRHCLPQDKGGVREDGRDLLEEFRQAGYNVFTSVDDMLLVNTMPALGLFAMKDMAPEIDRDPALEPSLAEMTHKALSLLSQDEDGFFLMVEGSQIDWAGHDNDVAYNVHETLAMDEAVEVALLFARKNPGTLVIVAADHETGALSIGKDYHFDPVALRNIKASCGKIADLIGEDRSKAAQILKEYAGIEKLTDTEVALIESASSVLDAVKTILNDRVGVIWGSGNHSGVMLPLSAEGPSEELFGGFYDNTDVPKKIAEAMGLEF